MHADRNEGNIIAINEKLLNNIAPTTPPHIKPEIKVTYKIIFRLSAR